MEVIDSDENENEDSDDEEVPALAPTTHHDDKSDDEAEHGEVEARLVHVAEEVLGACEPGEALRT